MKKTVLSLCVLALISLAFAFSYQAKKPGKYKAGDLIFISNPAGQGKAIQLATKSKFTHMGIILPDAKGNLVVYHAVEPVKKNTITEFVAMSADGKYDLMRLKDSIVLRDNAVSKMVDEAQKLMGKHYDKYFGWSDMEIYCSEFVWKIYKRAIYLEISPLKKLSDFDLTSPLVQKTMAERYGDKIPMDEKMVSPGDMHDWEGLIKAN